MPAGDSPPRDGRGLAASDAGPDGDDLGAGDQFGAGGLGGLPQRGVQPLAVNAADRRGRARIGPGSGDPQQPAATAVLIAGMRGQVPGRAARLLQPQCAQGGPPAAGASQARAHLAERWSPHQHRDPPPRQRQRDRRGAPRDPAPGTSGIHALSHRAVDERAGLPAGTAANYFPTRDELLTAAARRVFGLHIAAMEAADSQVAGPVGPGELAALIGASLHESATRHRTRYLAIYELTLEATRRPALAEALSGMGAAALDVTIGQHRALGLDTSPQQVQALITLFGGVLAALAAGPPEAVTLNATAALARCLVAGVLATVPGLAWNGPA